jgi:hypothetical protein
MSYHDDRLKRKNGLLPALPTRKEKKPLKKVSDKKKLADSLDKGSDSELDLWFVAKRREMKGRCLFCNQKTEKENDETYRRSIAHLLPKNKNSFPSVATHPDNFIELCFHNNSCHTNFDTGKITWEFIFDSKEAEIIREKLMNILPMVAENERKNKLYDKLVKLTWHNS